MKVQYAAAGFWIADAGRVYATVKNAAMHESAAFEIIILYFMPVLKVPDERSSMREDNVCHRAVLEGLSPRGLFGLFIRRIRCILLELKVVIRGS